MKLALLLLVVPVVFCHLCILWPEQRGGLKLPIQPGDDQCFQPHAPCGTVKPATPNALLHGTSTAFILFQQNLNHYNPGWPGFFDVAYAVGDNQTSDDDFIVLAQIPDFWAHKQDTQTNISLPFEVPNIDCDWCTLRVRYHPNKPTEPIFHNCADISIKKSSYDFNERMFGFLQVYPRNYLNRFVEISLPGGTPKPVGVGVHVFKRSLEQLNFYITSGLVAPVLDQESIYFIGDTMEVWEQGQVSPSILYQFDAVSEEIEEAFPLYMKIGEQWNALLTFPENPSTLLGVKQVSVNESFAYEVYAISLADGTLNLLGVTDESTTFVNFFWAGYDSSNSTVYILAGDENSLTTLDALLYSVNIKTTESSNVAIDNSKFTLDHFHVDPTTGVLYAFSPGLFGETNWSLVTINPKSGAVTSVFALSIGDEFLSEYGGAVHNGFANGKIYHTFRWDNTLASVLLIVDIKTGDILYQTDLVAQEMKLNNMVLYN